MHGQIIYLSFDLDHLEGVFNHPSSYNADNYFFTPFHSETADLWPLGKGQPVRANIVKGEWAEVAKGRKGARVEGKGSCLMSHKLWHPLRCVFISECGHILWIKTTREHVLVGQQRVWSVMYTAVWVYQALNKMICGFFFPLWVQSGSLLSAVG